MRPAGIICIADLGLNKVSPDTSLVNGGLFFEFESSNENNFKSSNFEDCILSGVSKENTKNLLRWSFNQSPAKLEIYALNNAYVFRNSGAIFLADHGCFLDISLHSICGNVLILDWLIGKIRGIDYSKSSGICVDEQILLNASRIETPVFFPFHSGSAVYGHWWYDCMPPIHAMRNQISKELPLLLPNYTLTSWQISALDLLGASIYQADIEGDVVFCPRLIVPSFIGAANTRNCSPLTNKMFTEVRRNSGCLLGGDRKIYVSRSSFKSYRRMINEPDVESALSTCGFDIVHPETQSLQQQISLFASSRVVLGAAGSGTVNIGFSNAGTTLIDMVVEGHIDPAFFYRAKSLCLERDGRYAIHCDSNFQDKDPELLNIGGSIDSSMLYSYSVSIPDLINCISILD